MCVGCCVLSIDCCVLFVGCRLRCGLFVVRSCVLAVVCCSVDVLFVGGCLCVIVVWNVVRCVVRCALFVVCCVCAFRCLLSVASKW